MTQQSQQQIKQDLIDKKFEILLENKKGQRKYINSRIMKLARISSIYDEETKQLLSRWCWIVDVKRPTEQYRISLARWNDLV